MADFPYLSVLRNWQNSIGRIVAWTPAHDKQTVFLIKTDKGQRLVFKQIQHVPTDDRLTSEYRVLHYLHKHGIPVSVPLLTDNGEFYTEVEGQIFTLSPALSVTTHHTKPNERHRYSSIGRALGRFHYVMSTYPDPIESWTMNLPYKLENDVFPFLEQAFESQKFTQLQQRITPIKQALYYIWEQLPTQYIHGDFHGGNILFDGGKVTGFIDLDHLPIGARIYDLSYFLADEGKTRIDDKQKLTSWLDSFQYMFEGYTEEISLSSDERNAIWYGMLITQLLFVYWFAKSKDQVNLEKNLKVLNWIYDHKQNIYNSLAE